jgi:hypothetical protein
LAQENLDIFLSLCCGDSALEDEPPAYIVMPEPHVETAMRILNIKGIRATGD